eukprot:7337005-Prymnesium_polylepis.1
MGSPYARLRGKRHTKIERHCDRSARRVGPRAAHERGNAPRGRARVALHFFPNVRRATHRREMEISQSIFCEVPTSRNADGSRATPVQSCSCASRMERP